MHWTPYISLGSHSPSRNAIRLCHMNKKFGFVLDIEGAVRRLHTTFTLPEDLDPEEGDRLDIRYGWRLNAQQQDDLFDWIAARVHTDSLYSVYDDPAKPNKMRNLFEYGHMFAEAHGKLVGGVFGCWIVREDNKFGGGVMFWIDNNNTFPEDRYREDEYKDLAEALGVTEAPRWYCAIS
ncbi:hypothetical protein MIND_01199100 [Mycena indigotica]|uniref:Uncharacterized protein n=1 Tax=Mycena indigotica TaxID=2126181 RepID=A0A8H6VWS1_9AGAR|nr:uncharacterized protein MIND_01199100 [Mycena indigotica]KAF7292998.1 hypothetical protein MIND_01199100 [Mycena indigotica]